MLLLLSPSSVLPSRLADLGQIDRICSNQHDGKEKSQQVSLMRDIFERSRQTIAWLGGPEKEDNQRIAAGITKLNSMTFTLLDSLLERHTGKQDADSSRGQISSKSQQSKIGFTASQGISQLLKKGWFVSNPVLFYSDGLGRHNLFAAPATAYCGFGFCVRLLFLIRIVGHGLIDTRDGFGSFRKSPYRRQSSSNVEMLRLTSMC